MVGQSKFGHGANARVNDSKDDVGPETLTNDAGPVSPFWVGVGKVGIAAFVDQRPLRIGQKGVGQFLRMFRFETRRVRPDRSQCAMKAPDRRRVYSKMNIGRTGLLTDCEIFINVTQQLS